MVAGKIHDEGERALALAVLAGYLADCQPETAAGMATAALASLGKLQGADRQHLQADVAVALAARDPAEGLALLQKVEDAGICAEALKRIVARLARTRPEEALRVLQSVGDWQLREAALIEIMPAIAHLDPKRALAATDEILSRRDRVHALLTIAAALTEPAPAEKAGNP